MGTRKNHMRTPEEKEKIVLESFDFGTLATARKYDIHKDVLIDWRNKYRINGFEGLVSQTGRASGNPLVGKMRKKNKTREDELELENLKLKIEVARLKKGYLVKGVGIKKEYVTIKDSNMKS